MTTRARIEKIYKAQTDAFSDDPQFQALENGSASRKDYEVFLANVGKTHMQSPKILGFLFAIAPPQSSDAVKHNLLEELGLEEAEESHPDLLRNMMKAAGFDEATLSRLEQEAQEEIRRMCQSPMMYGTIRSSASISCWKSFPSNGCFPGWPPESVIFS